ncbi:glycosyltransferase family 4 protein [Capilliphycus salinus ALCB114379]|uniref:glycosyltransferase family 4 protein n=1 Tax=Capilliphycus salinus TaxID=2768948 RepID=UPI0039A6827D
MPNTHLGKVETVSVEQYTSSETSTIFPNPQLSELSIITQFYPPDYAATGQLIAELAAQLQSLGMQVKIFTGQPGYAFKNNKAPQKQIDKGVHIQRTRTTQIWSKRIRGKALNGLFFCFRAGLHLLRSVNRSQILVLTTAPPYLTILGYLAHLCFGQRYICLLYDLYPDVAVELGVVSRQNPLVKFWDWINCKVWKKADAIIVLSSTMKDRIAAKSPEIEEKITVIQNWADPNFIKPLDKNENWFAREFNLLEKFTVLYSGNMGRCHDMNTIMEAAIELRDEPIQFVFIGGGAKRESCIKKVRELGLNNCVFLPYQDKAVLPYSLTACDLSLVSVTAGMEGIVAPSKFYGILAAGSPVAVVCESHSYLRQLLAEAKCGVAFDNGEGTQLAQFIRLLASEPELAHRMGDAGRQYLEAKLTPEIIAKQYFTTLSKVKV